MPPTAQAQPIPSAASVYNQVVDLYSQGRYLEALKLAEAALAQAPNDIALLNAAATSARAGGLPEPAQRYWQQAVSLNPSYVDGYYNLGVLFSELKRDAEAENSYRQAVDINPQYTAAYNNLAILLQGQQRLEEAETNYRQALQANPNYIDALYNLGVLLQEQQRYEEADTCYHRVLAINPAHSGALNNRGVMLQAQRRYEEANAVYLQVLALVPDYAEAHRNRGYLLQQMKRFEEAEACYRKALALKPGYADANWSLGMLLLYLGRFEEGWLRYEARYDPSIQKRTIHPPELSIPQWKGQPLAGKRIAVWSEQALGDDFQLCRYLPELKKLGAAHVAFVCKAALKPLLQRLDGVDALLTREEGGDFSGYDYWTLLFSLPLHCKTTLSTVPCTIPYLSAKPEYLSPIADKLNSVTGLKIGVCWKGSALYMANAERSPGIQAFAQLFRMPGAHFFTLLPDSRSEFLPVAGDAAVDLEHEVDADTPAFEETAALISALDLIITSDTSLAHLAGALGKPVWMVLPYVADWRWMDQGEDTPWYPNMRLFRQTQRGDWAGVFERVIARLQHVIGKNAPLLWPIQAYHSDTPAQQQPPASKNTLSLAQQGMLTAHEMFQHAEQLERENQAEAAAALYRAWLNHTPPISNPVVYFNIGIALERTGDTLGSEQAYRVALQLQDTFIPAHINLALLLQRQERLDEALSQWRRLFKLNPANSQENQANYILALNNFGLFLEQYYRPHEAEQIFKTSLSVNPNQPAVLSKLIQLQSLADIGFQTIPTAESPQAAPLNKHSLISYCLARTNPTFELPESVKILRLGAYPTEEISSISRPTSDKAGLQPTLGEPEAIFAIKNDLEANPQYERVAICSEQKYLVPPFAADHSKPQQITEIIPRYAYQELLIARPINLLHHGINNALQHCQQQQHGLETLLRFLAESLSAQLLEAHEVYEILNAKLWIPGCGTLGVYPSSLYINIATKLEKMVCGYEKKYSDELTGQNNNALASCCGYVWNYFLLKHLAANYPGGIPSCCFGHIVDHKA